MLSFWVYVGGIVAVLAIAGFQFWFLSGRRAPWNRLQDRVGDLLEQLQKESSKEPDADLATWRAQMERRMEILEADVIRHLQKINQRAAVAERAERKRAVRDDEEPDEPDLNQVDADQLQLLLGRGKNGGRSIPEEVTLDQVRAAMNRR